MNLISSFKINGRDNYSFIEGNPIFSWSFLDENNLKQESYQILITDEKDTLIWDSSLINSSNTLNIEYLGPTLKSRNEYFVKLIVHFNNKEKCEFNTNFETTLSKEEWHADWIGFPCGGTNSSLLVRGELRLEKGKKIKKARAYIAGLGYHEFYVNGKKVGDMLLTPPVSDYSKTIYYEVYPFENFLDESSKNVVGVELGNGWLGNKKLLLQIYIEYEDGTIYEDHASASYGSWWFSSSSICSNSIYDGEVFDARKEERLKDWCTSSYVANGSNNWFPSVFIQKETGELKLDKLEPIRICNVYTPIKKEILDDGHILIDFGQNLSGFTKINVSGNKGDKIKLYFAEVLKDDGHIDQINLRSAKCRDIYILKGTGNETYSPKFTFRGFRYCEICIDGNVSLNDIIAYHVHNDVSNTGDFTCDDLTINKLHHMARITELNNLYGIMSDCPQRDERFGWLNDISARIFQNTYNFNMENMFEKISRDIVDAQGINGEITDTAPYYTGGKPADTSTVSFLLLPLFSYKFYGNKKLVSYLYPYNKKWVNYLLSRSKDYVMDYYYYADWVKPETLKDSNSDSIFVSSLFLLWHLETMLELAKINKDSNDIKTYENHIILSKKSLREKYFNSSVYGFGNNSQCENAMAITLGLVKEEEIPFVTKNIVNSIIANNYHIACGNQGYRHIFYVLSEYGYIDLALKVLKNEEYPGWGYMLKCGATTVWERWEKEASSVMNSFNHPMFGSYDAIFYKYIAGINIDGCGADKICIYPKIPSTINHFESSFKTVRGEIISNFKKEGKLFEFTIKVPSNTNIEFKLDSKIKSINSTLVNTNSLSLDSGIYTIISEIE